MSGRWDGSHAGAWGKTVQFAYSQNQEIGVKESYPRPEKLTKVGIKEFQAFLLQSCTSKPTAEYGGSGENGTRLILDIVGVVCRVTRNNYTAISGTDWLEGIYTRQAFVDTTRCVLPGSHSV